MRLISRTMALALVLAAAFVPLGCDCGCGDDDDDGGKAKAPDDDMDDDTGDDDLTDDDTSGAPVTTADPEGGTYGDSVTVTLTAVDDTTSNPTIYYTTDGMPPVVGAPGTQSGISPLELSPFTENTTLQFFAVDEDDIQESTHTEEYVVDTEAPVTTADEPGGQYNIAVDVVLTSTDDTDDAPTIYYRTDGGDPAVGDPDTEVGDSPVDLGSWFDNFTLKYFAVDEFGHQEEMKTEEYEFDLNAPNTVATPPGGVFTSPIEITLTSTDNDDPVPTIYYRTDGGSPSIGNPDTLWGNSPVTITNVSTNTTLRFFAVDDSNNQEFPKQENYIFDFEAPVCDASPGPGLYNGPYPPLSIGPLEVTLDCPDNLAIPATIYYTVNGTQPVIGDPGTFSGASPVTIELPRTADVRFFAVDQAGYQSAEEVRSYEILYWDDFEPWLAGMPPGYPWYIFTDPWSCTIPTIETIATVPGGKVARMVDINLACPEGDSYASLLVDGAMPWPDQIGFQFDMRLRAGQVGGFGSYYFEDPNQPWRTIVYFRNGNIEAFDMAQNGGAGGWVTCQTGFTINEWYAIDVRVDRPNESYSVYIGGALSACSDLQTFFDGIGDPTDMSGAKFVTEGPSNGTFEANNFRIYDTTL